MKETLGGKGVEQKRDKEMARSRTKCKTPERNLDTVNLYQKRSGSSKRVNMLFNSYFT